MPDKKEKQTLLTIRGLKTFFPVKSGFLGRAESYVQAVNDIDLTIYRGETLGLVGESGCGKTTLGKTILQLYKPTAGEMIYEFEDGSRNLAELKKDEMDMARRKIQIVFQDPQSSLNPSFTIYQSLSDPLKKFGVKTKAERRKVIGDLLEAVNMRREYMDRYPHEFSGGQRQRIGIARALCINPELVICDEAVSALDVSIQAQVLQLINDLKRKFNTSMILITHDLGVVAQTCDNVAVVYAGEIVEYAEKVELFDHPAHPYTLGLFGALPAMSENSDRLEPIAGMPPDPTNLPPGCSFHPRCPHATKACEGDIPYTEIAPGHFCRCRMMKKQED